MREYLLERANDYIDLHRHFTAKRSLMTDQERDEIDRVWTSVLLLPLLGNGALTPLWCCSRPSSFRR